MSAFACFVAGVALGAIAGVEFACYALGFDMTTGWD